VETTGFESVVYPTFALALNQAVRVEVRMKVGAVTFAVGVRGITTLLQKPGKEMAADLVCGSV